MSQIENYKNCGFANDNDLKVLQSTILRLSEIHMDIYIENTAERREAFQTLVKWMVKNKHRCFLEVQYHNCENQKIYNKKMYFYSKKTGIPLIAGTDTHSSSPYKAECRKILQKYKDSFYGEEDEFDLTWKTYEELIAAFKAQNCLPEEVYMEAIRNTNVLADMVEEFTLDKAFKYPTLYGDNVREQWKQLIYTNFDEKCRNGKLKLPSKILRECNEYFAEHPITPTDESEREIYENYKARCPNPSPSQCTVRCPNSSCQNIMTLALCKEFKTSEDKNEFKYKYDE